MKKLAARLCSLFVIVATNAAFAVCALFVITTCRAAHSADLPVKAPVAPASAYNWTGFYVGGNAGYGWGTADHNWNLTLNSNPFFGLPPSGMSGSDANKLSGPFGGLQAGYNWQAQNVLAGIEADIQSPGQTKDRIFLGTNIFANGLPTNTATITYSDKLLWFGTLRARAGVIANDRWLIFATGGFAYGRVAVEGVTSIPPSSVGFMGLPGVSVPPASFNVAGTAVGWTLGGGIENALGNNWSWKAEYLYLNLTSISGSYPVQAPPGTGCTATPGGCFNVFSASGAAASRLTDNILRVGINYKFGP